MLREFSHIILNTGGWDLRLGLLRYNFFVETMSLIEQGVELIYSVLLLLSATTKL